MTPIDTKRLYVLNLPYEITEEVKNLYFLNILIKKKNNFLFNFFIFLSKGN